MVLYVELPHHHQDYGEDNNRKYEAYEKPQHNSGHALHLFHKTSWHREVNVVLNAVRAEYQPQHEGNKRYGEQNHHPACHGELNAFFHALPNPVYNWTWILKLVSGPESALDCAYYALQPFRIALCHRARDDYVSACPNPFPCAFSTPYRAADYQEDVRTKVFLDH